MSLGVYHGVALTIDANGFAKIAPEAEIRVYREDTGALASIFEDADGTTPITNGGGGFTADEEGRFTFYAAAVEGGFKIEAYEAGVLKSTLRNVPIGTAQYRDIEDFGAQLGATTTRTEAMALLGIFDPCQLAFSVGSGALTVALKNASGNDPSAEDPVRLRIRSDAADDPSEEVLDITSALSLVLSSGSTLGVPSGQPFRLWFVIFNDDGTPRLGAINCMSLSASYLGLRNGMITSSTAEGGAGGADSACVVYTGQAVEDKPLRILGYAEWEGLTTAGTWDEEPVKVHMQSPGDPQPGDIIQIRDSYAEAGSSTNSTSMVDVTNGSLAITPTSACNIILVDFAWRGMSNTVGGVNTKMTYNLVRGGNTLAGSSSELVVGFDDADGQNRVYAGLSVHQVDRPRSTETVTYKLQHAHSSASSSGETDNISKRLMEVMA